MWVAFLSCASSSVIWGRASLSAALSVKGVDQEHAAGRQAGALDVAGGVFGDLAGLDGQRGMQPAFARLGGQGLQAAWQVMGFRARDDRVPERIGAGGKALERIRRHVEHLAVVAFHLVAGVAQHQRAPRRRGQEFLDALEPVLVQHGHLAASLQLGHVACQRAQVGRVQLEQLELVTLAQQALDDEGRAGVDPRGRPLVEGAYHVQIGLQGRLERGNARSDQPGDAVGRFGAGVGIVAVQPVQACAGMGVQHGQGRIFLDKVLQGSNQHRVLEHVGVVACMEGVAVTEHPPMVTSVSPRADISAADPSIGAFSRHRVARTMQDRAELRAGRLLRDVFGRWVAFCFNAPAVMHHDRWCRGAAPRSSSLTPVPAAFPPSFFAQ